MAAQETESRDMEKETTNKHGREHGEETTSSPQQPGDHSFRVVFSVCKPGLCGHHRQPVQHQDL